MSPEQREALDKKMTKVLQTSSNTERIRQLCGPAAQQQLNELKKETKKH